MYMARVHGMRADAPRERWVKDYWQVYIQLFMKGIVAGKTFSQWCSFPLAVY